MVLLRQGQVMKYLKSKFNSFSHFLLLAGVNCRIRNRRFTIASLLLSEGTVCRLSNTVITIRRARDKRFPKPSFSRLTDKQYNGFLRFSIIKLIYNL